MRRSVHCALAPIAVLGISTLVTGCIEADAATPSASKNGNNTGEFSETSVIVEINATDGDVGFHALLDADAWREARIDDPQGKLLFEVKAKGSLLTQGLTENFFESDEPLCAPDPEDPEAEVVPLSEFLQRFPDGSYRFTGITLDNERLAGVDLLTHDLPAAPEDVSFDGALITWAAGSNLGGCHDDELVNEGVIPDPSTVSVVSWEIAVGPADEEAVDPLHVFTVQVPGDAPTAVTVPPEFINSYIEAGVTAFKVEVGAIEASGNRTFSEEEFDLQAP